MFSKDDIALRRRIVFAQSETIRQMKEVDEEARRLAGSLLVDNGWRPRGDSDDLRFAG